MFVFGRVVFVTCVDPSVVCVRCWFAVYVWFCVRVFSLSFLYGLSFQIVRVICVVMGALFVLLVVACWFVCFACV